MKKLLVSLIVLMFPAAPASAQNLVVNGSFEEPHFTGNAYEWFDDGDNIGAWDVISPGGQGVLVGYDTINTPPSMWKNMAEGTQLLHIGESTGENTVTQTISGFTVGAKYELSLASCEYTAAYDNILYLQVYNDGTASYDLDITYTDSPPSGPTMEYSYHEFTASGATLDLIITNDDDAAMTIDDVSIVMVGTKVGTTDPSSLEVWENAAQGPTSDTFTIVLDSSPGATDTITVDIDPNSNGNGKDLTVNGSADPITITFTSADWDTAQTITVAAIDDTIADGQTEVDQVGFTVTSSDPCDPCYASAVIPAVDVTIHDDDSDAVVVSKTTASATEGGAGDSYTIQLATDPTNPVTVIVAAENLVVASPTDSNMVPDPFDCQLTVNGGGSDTLVFTQKEVPQTVTITAVNDSLYEADPHVITIGNHVETDDLIYSNISAANVDVSITENNPRTWNFGDDVLLSLPPNSSFETPVLSEVESYFNPDPSYGPFGTQDYAEPNLPITHISDPCWAVMYEVGQTVPDGDNVLVMPGNVEDIQYLTYTSRPCEYLIEPGPVSYTLTVAMGLPKEAGGEANPDAYAQLEFWWYSDESYGQLASTGDLIAQLTEGQWQDIKLCTVIEADAVETGVRLGIELWGEHVQFDNVRLSVGNHPCDGCYQDNPTWDLTGPEGVPDCKVDLLDFSGFALDWLECNLYPECVTGW